MVIAIYNWRTAFHHLLQTLFPEAILIDGSPRNEVNTVVQEAQHLRARFPDQIVHFFFQINLSNWSDWFSDFDYLRAVLAELHFRLYNDQVTDIRKRSLQEQLLEIGLPSVALSGDEPLDTLVMVKTDYNYGGEFEAMLSLHDLQAMHLIDPGDSPVASFDQYYVTELGTLPKATFENPFLAVERYVVNRDHRFYRFYRCSNAVVLSEIINPARIKKMDPGLPRRNWFFEFGNHRGLPFQSLLEDVTTLCSTMGLHFGAIDIVMDDADTPYIIDLNTTPGWGSEQQDEMLNHLRAGIS